MASKIINGDLSFFDDEPLWKNFRQKVNVQLLVESVKDENTEGDEDKGSQDSISSITLDLSVLHILVVLNDEEIMTAIVEKNIIRKHWLDPIQLIKPNKIKIAQENQWIEKANCFHLAAKFNPTGLHLMLSQLKTDQDVFQKLYENGQCSPLHVAALNSDSLSLR